MKVLVTGATGFVGTQIVRSLSESGHTVRIFARNELSPKVRSLVPEFSTELACGDILDPPSLKNAMVGVEAVIHLVGIISEVGKNTFENVHAIGTRNVVEAANAAGVRRFIHMSALGTRPVAQARYHQTKWAAEESVRQCGIPFTIFRPSLIYGRQDQFVNTFARIARWSPIVPLIGRPEARFQPVAVELVARAFVLSLTEERAINQTNDLCGPERLTLAEMVDSILLVTGRQGLKWHVPSGLARAQARFLEFLFGRLLGKAAPLNRDQLIMLEEGNIGNPEPADFLFGLRHNSFGEGIARYLRGKSGDSA